jgi:hypothetical protein
MARDSSDGYTEVGIAVICLWVTQVLEVLYVFFARVPHHAFAVLSPTEVMVTRIISVCFTLALYAWLIIKIAGGRNWARITYLVFFLIGCPFYILFFVTLFRHVSVGGVLNALQFCLTLFAMITLFTAPGKYWFAKS